MYVTKYDVHLSVSIDLTNFCLEQVCQQFSNKLLQPCVLLLAQFHDELARSQIQMHSGIQTQLQTVIQSALFAR